MGIFEVIAIVNLDEERALNWFNDSWINKIGKPEYKLELDLKTNGLFYNAIIVKGSYEAFKELIDILWHSRIEGELVKKLQKVFESVYTFECKYSAFNEIVTVGLANSYNVEVINANTIKGSVENVYKFLSANVSFEGGIPSFEKVLNEYGTKIIF